MWDPEGAIYDNLGYSVAGIGDLSLKVVFSQPSHVEDPLAKELEFGGKETEKRGRRPCWTRSRCSVCQLLSDTRRTGSVTKLAPEWLEPHVFPR